MAKEESNIGTESVVRERLHFNFFTMVKMILMAFAIGFIIITLSNMVVGYSHIWAKVIGLVSDAGNIVCDYCASLIG